jgi:hypothetical protein
MPDEISFIGVVLRVEAKTTVSQDKVARITIETDNMDILDCGKWPPNECVSVGIVRDTVRR